MSNGGPDSSVSSGFRRIFHFVASSDPPSDTRLRISVEAGPYSPAMLYGFAGIVFNPSVLLRA
jgi:hypothetical protein